jgi:tRNA pseudouridine38-40 synthase
MRYFIEIAYRGTAYCGWQIQPNGATVQGLLEEALSKTARKPIATVGCGRTDAGVHASQFYLHCDLDSVPDFLVFRLNKMLPPDISIARIIPVHDKAHARFDALERGYTYTVVFNKSALQFDNSWWVDKLRIDFDLLIEATKIIAQTNDFTTFAKVGGNSQTMLCSMRNCTWAITQDSMVLHINANRFLRGMVRRIVGALINVAQHKLPIEEFELSIKQKKLFKINTAAPPQGLTLCTVAYPYHL